MITNALLSLLHETSLKSFFGGKIELSSMHGRKKIERVVGTKGSLEYDRDLCPLSGFEMEEPRKLAEEI